MINMAAQYHGLSVWAVLGGRLVLKWLVGVLRSRVCDIGLEKLLLIDWQLCLAALWLCLGSFEGGALTKAQNCRHSRHRLVSMVRMTCKQGRVRPPECVECLISLTGGV